MIVVSGRRSVASYLEGLLSFLHLCCQHGVPSGSEASLFFSDFPFDLGLSLFKVTFSMTLPGCLMKLIVL